MTNLIQLNDAASLPLATNLDSYQSSLRTQGVDQKVLSAKQELELHSHSDESDAKDKHGRRKVTHACVHCQKAHISCDTSRPCKRCVEKGLEDTCVDSEGKKRGRKKIYESIEERPSRKRKYPKHKHQQPQSQNQHSKNAKNVYVTNPSTLQLQQQPLSSSNEQLLSSSSSSSLMGANPDEWDFNQLLDIPGNISDVLFFPFDLEIFPDANTAAPSATTPIPGTDPSTQQALQDPSSSSGNALAPIYNTNNNTISQQSLQQQQQQQNILDLLNASPTRLNGQQLSLPSSSSGSGTSSPTGAAPPKIIPSWSESAWLGLLDKNSTVSTCATYYYRMFSFLNDRVYKNYPKEAEEMYTFLMRNKQRLMELKQNLTADQVLMVKRDFTLYLSSFARAYDQAAVPTVVWERCAVIRYMNQSFKNLTGFPYQIPTELFEFQMLKSVSRASVFHIMSTLRACFLDVNFGSVMLPCALRIWKMPDGKVIESEGDMACYIEGTMCITFKRDLLGMPLLSLGQFLPALTPNYQYKYVWEKM